MTRASAINATQMSVIIALQGSSVVMVSSYAAYHAEPPIAMYAVTKTAVVALSKALANELGPEGIRVNCIAPGWAPVSDITTIKTCTYQLVGTAIWLHTLLH